MQPTRRSGARLMAKDVIPHKPHMTEAPNIVSYALLPSNSMGVEKALMSAGETTSIFVLLFELSIDESRVVLERPAHPPKGRPSRSRRSARGSASPGLRLVETSRRGLQSTNAPKASDLRSTTGRTTCPGTCTPARARRLGFSPVQDGTSHGPARSGAKPGIVASRRGDSPARKQLRMMSVGSRHAKVRARIES